MLKLNFLNDYTWNNCDDDDDDVGWLRYNVDYLGNSLWPAIFWLDYEIFAKALVKLIVWWMEMELGMVLMLLMVYLSGFHFTFMQFGVLTVFGSGFGFGFVAPTHNCHWYWINFLSLVVFSLENHLDIWGLPNAAHVGRLLKAVLSICTTSLCYLLLAN